METILIILLLSISNAVFVWIGYTIAKGGSLVSTFNVIKRTIHPYSGSVIRAENEETEKDKVRKYMDDFDKDPSTKPPEGVDLSKINWDDYK